MAQELFEPLNCRRWVRPELLDVIGKWQSAKNTGDENAFKSRSTWTQTVYARIGGSFSIDLIVDFGILFRQGLPTNRETNARICLILRGGREWFCHTITRCYEMRLDVGRYRVYPVWRLGAMDCYGVSLLLQLPGVDLDSFEGFQVEAPGIFSFPALTDEFCELLLKDMAAARHGKVPKIRPLVGNCSKTWPVVGCLLPFFKDFKG